MWKKTAALCLVVCLLLALAACQRARVPGLDWDAEEMVELRLERVMYLVGEKTTTDPQEIRFPGGGVLQRVPLQPLHLGRRVPAAEGCLPHSGRAVGLGGRPGGVPPGAQPHPAR